MGLLERFQKLVHVEPMPDFTFNQKKRTLLRIAKKMRWYRNIGGEKTPEEWIIAELERIKEFDKNWTQEDEEALYGSEKETAMFKVTLRMRDYEAKKELGRAKEIVARSEAK